MHPMPSDRKSDAPIRFCIFDIGGVAIRLKALEAYRGMPGYPHPMRPEELWAWFEALPELTAWETGRADVDDFARATIAGLGLAVTVEEFRERVDTILDAPMPGMESLIRRTASVVTTVALSNANAFHWKRVARDYPVMGHFHKVFASHLIGLRKPDPECFGHVLTQLGAAPGETLFFDDSQGNVDAALRLGIRAVRFENPQQCAGVLAREGVEAPEAE